MEDILVKCSIMLVPALLAVTAHELAHGYAADRLGDPTARLLGRLTFNPLRHLDLFGTLALLLVGFGWARPVPVNPGNLRNPHRHMLWVALSGPLANLLLALASALLLRLLALVPDTAVVELLSRPLALMAAFSLYINLILALLNLMPVPPLDGGRILAALLPPAWAARLRQIEPFGLLLVIGLIFFTDLWSLLFAPVILAAVALLAGPQAAVVAEVMRFLFGG
ncbi:site-2 protease family protein [Desulfuromonas thiophila]|uniref:Zn-dependent protease (Includes SpoIVFB) n=1 Tax=Desulfuromonas thiophila TaxID=57664 RepID=A0A1G7CXH7_9BACT|nr:site-2 protease family protein [Desulfuromonas thiophila]SDE44042.1 Zn-dependent protease (includes SpoIVFB) [Desulfuromonas thiophila]